MSRFEVISIDEATDVTEPISLIEFKEHARISSTDEDPYNTKLIKRIRKKFESAIWQSLVPKTITAVFYNDDNWRRSWAWGMTSDWNLTYTELPHGPLLTAGEISSIVDIDGNDIDVDSYVIRGNSIWVGNTQATLEYEVGYEIVPDDIKQALLELTAWHYLNRGDQSGNAAQEKTRELTSPFTKQTMIL